MCIVLLGLTIVREHSANSRSRGQRPFLGENRLVRETQADGQATTLCVGSMSMARAMEGQTDRHKNQRVVHVLTQAR